MVEHDQGRDAYRRMPRSGLDKHGVAGQWLAQRRAYSADHLYVNGLEAFAYAVSGANKSSPVA